MKTKKHMYESRIQRIVWLETREKIIMYGICLTLIIIGVRKYEFFTTDIISASKWFLIAIGYGFCWGSLVSYLIPSKWILQNKRDRLHQKVQNCWAKRNSLHNFVEENPDNKKAKIRLEKVEYRWEKLTLVSKSLNNPYKT